jgi:hypothetical protein
MRFRPPAWLLAAVASLLAPPCGAEPVSFNRDIRPILSDVCFHCHGNDAKTREAGMRLDDRAAALRQTESGGIPIVPGDPDASEIIRRIFDDADPMPPESAHKPLSAAQKELFRRWVAEGAVYEPHWAYAPLARPAVPAAAAGTNPIDAFIDARLGAKGLKPSPEAPPQLLERRLALDLTGLPPQAALPATTPRPAGEALVDALLASPHFGERMAVWWLDIARFADTVGFHGDQNQRIFPYRDWVIAAFNDNKPFDAFTREQLAGDLLPNPTDDQLVATGYNRLTMMTREGGAQAKEYLAKYGAERVRAVSAAWFGSTFGCAECHDHKFDPISARDFYELQAFFADMKQWGVYSFYDSSPEPELEGFDNESPFPPEVQVESPWLVKELGRTRQRLADAIVRAAAAIESDSAIRDAATRWDAEIQSFLASHPDGWITPRPELPCPDEPTSEPSASQAAEKSPQPSDRPTPLRATFTAHDLAAVATVRLSVVAEGAAPEALATILGKQFKLEVSVQPVEGKPRTITIRAGDATAKRAEYLSGAEVPGITAKWKVPAQLPEGGAVSATWLLDPVRLAAGERLVVSIRNATSDMPLRLAASPLGAVHPLDAAAAADLAALREPAANRSPEQRSRVATAFLLSTAHDRSTFDALATLAARERELFGGKAWTMVTQPRPDPLTVRVLPRGNWQDESGPVVLPATPSFLPGRIESSPERRLTRLDLANWITSDANPITPRAVMNRLWATFFGTGLSGVVDDLGSQGEPPSHPELLDWLACEFRESGWDLKHMIRLMVTSRAYRRTSSLSAEALAVDPANRLLATQNPRRLDAEFVRDNALAIAGLLNADDIGGPSVKPYQPDGYYEAIQFPDRTYEAERDSRQWRRGVYVHWQRTFLHPMLANFDAPARDECCACRMTSNTPQQALTLLNDPEFVEAARGFAARLLLGGSATDDAARIRLAYRLALDREPRSREVESLAAFLAARRASFAADPAAAAASLDVGIAQRPDLDPVEHAAWAQLCRVLLNTQEVITRY